MNSFFYFLIFSFQDDIYPLCSAAKNGELEEVKQLLLKGANVNWKDKSGWVSLILFFNTSNSDFF